MLSLPLQGTRSGACPLQPAWGLGEALQGPSQAVNELQLRPLTAPPQQASCLTPSDVQGSVASTRRQAWSARRGRGVGVSCSLGVRGSWAGGAPHQASGG